MRGVARAAVTKEDGCYCGLNCGLVLFGAETAEKSGRAASSDGGLVDEILSA